MNAETSRYLFETDFDNPEAVERKALKYCEDDIAAAKQEGMQLARAEAVTFEEKRATELLTGMSAKLDILAEQRGEIIQSAAEVAIVMCRKMLPTLAAQNALSEIEGHIVRTLTEVHGEPRVVVRVAAENIAALQAHIDTLSSGFDGEVVLMADEQLPTGDCQVMWADGGNDRDVERTWAEIDKAIEQIVSNDTGLMAAAAASEPHPEATISPTETSTDSSDLDQSSQATY